MSSDRRQFADCHKSSLLESGNRADIPLSLKIVKEGNDFFPLKVLLIRTFNRDHGEDMVFTHSCFQALGGGRGARSLQLELAVHSHHGPGHRTRGWVQ